METEIWKPVVGYEKLYEISSLGRVKRIARTCIDSKGRNVSYKEIILKKQIAHQTGYPYVNLTKDGFTKTWNIHTLIANAFIPNPDNLPCVNHIDENRANSVLSNLERCTYAYNNSYGSAKQKRRNTYLERHGKTPIIQYNRKGCVVQKYPEGLKELNLKYQRKDYIAIRQCLYGNKKTALGFIWSYADIPFQYKDKPFYRTPVNQYDFDGNLINSFTGGLEEIQITSKYNIDNIRGCLKGKSKTSQGYVWLFEGVKFAYIKHQAPNKGKDFNGSKPKKHQKYVIKTDDEGNEIARYKSVSEAGIKNGFDRHYFSRKIDKDNVAIINGMRFVVEKKENCYIPIGHKGPRPDLIGKGAKAVCQYAKDGSFICHFNSLREAGKAMGNVAKTPDIINCCKGILKTAYGFIWKYAE